MADNDADLAVDDPVLDMRAGDQQNGGALPHHP
jgi:hypothetical protein